MTSRYRIRQTVESELEAIWSYSFAHWGPEQADKYLHDLFSRFAWLANNPKAGKQRDDINPGYYSFPEGTHVVFYVITPEGVDIIGVPHQSMDWLRYFE